jgi:transcriptional regulator with XRE-family HTH domain
MSENSINDKIREIRIKKRLSVKEAAGFLGMSVNGYLLIEKGSTNVHMRHLAKLAELFEMNPLEIITYPYKVSVLENLGDVSENSPWFHHLPPKEDNPPKTTIRHLESVIEEQRKTIEDLRYIIEQLKR